MEEITESAIDPADQVMRASCTNSSRQFDLEPFLWVDIKSRNLFKSEPPKLKVDKISFPDFT